MTEDQIALEENMPGVRVNYLPSVDFLHFVRAKSIDTLSILETPESTFLVKVSQENHDVILADGPGSSAPMLFSDLKTTALFVIEIFAIRCIAFELRD